MTYAKALIALLLLSMSPVWAADNTAPLQKSRDVAAAAFLKGDAATVAARYMENGALLAPSTAVLKGRAAIEKYWAGAIQSFSAFKRTVEDVVQLSPTDLREIGSFAATTKANPPQQVKGYYLTVWHRSSGNNWFMSSDSWTIAP